MGHARRVVLFFRFALILSASVALADCGTVIPPEDLEDHDDMADRTIMAAVQEVPVQNPVVDLPMPPELSAPKVVSNLPSPRVPPSVRKRMSLVRPPPPKETAPEPEPEAIAPSALVGFDYPAVLQVLRRPDMVHNSALSVVWTYSQSECTLQLYFYPDIQTRVFRLLKYDLKDGTGERPSDSSPCMRRMARNDEPASP